MSTRATTDTSVADPLTAAAKAAWLEYVKGTWSESDRRIWVDAFIKGAQWQKQRSEARGRHSRRGYYGQTSR